MEYDIKRVAHAIRTKRKLNGMTQEALAEAVGLSTNYVRQIEHGRKNPATKTLYAIFTVLNLRMDTIIFPQAEPEKDALIREISANLLQCPIESLKLIRDAVEGIARKLDAEDS